MELISKTPDDNEILEYYSSQVLEKEKPWQPYLPHEESRVKSSSRRDGPLIHWINWDSYRAKLFLIKSIIRSRLDYCPPGAFKNMLDLGCGLGYYTYELAEHFDYIDGVDVNSHSLKYALELCTTKNNVGFYSSIEDITAPWGYKFILMIDFLEHQNDPFKTLATTHKMLNDYLILSCPINEKTEFEDDFKKNHGHIWTFSKKSIEKLLDQEGFTVDFYLEYDAKRFKPFKECIIVAIKKGNYPTGYVSEQVDLYSK